MGVDERRERSESDPHIKGSINLNQLGQGVLHAFCLGQERPNSAENEERGEELAGHISRPSRDPPLSLSLCRF